MPRYKFVQEPLDAKSLAGSEKRASPDGEPAGTPAEKRSRLASPAAAQPKENVAPNDVQRVAQLHRSNEVRPCHGDPRFQSADQGRHQLPGFIMSVDQAGRTDTTTGGARTICFAALQELRKQLGEARERGDALQGELDATAKQRDKATKAADDLKEQVHVSLSAYTRQNLSTCCRL